MAKEKRTRGGQPRNQNARTHGFYSRVLDDAEQIDLELAAGVSGIDDEIALMRVKIMRLVEQDPDNLALLIDATNTLSRMVKTRYNLSQHDGDNVTDAISKVLKGLAIPLGVAGIKVGL